jgi:hypothetical protein
MKVSHERTLNDERENLWRPAYNQVIAFAVRRALLEWKATFINGIDFFGLRRMPETGG